MQTHSATFVESIVSRTGAGYDRVRHIFELSEPMTRKQDYGNREITSDRIEVSICNNDECDPVVVYLGNSDHWDGRMTLASHHSLVNVSHYLETALDIVVENMPAALATIPERANLRWSHSAFREGDTLVANELAPAPLTSGDRVVTRSLRGAFDTMAVALPSEECDEEGNPIERTIEIGRKHPGLRPARYRWTVEIEIDAQWVADGAEITDRSLLDILGKAFPYFTSREVTGRVVESPDAEDVAREQGYASAADRKTRAR